MPASGPVEGRRNGRGGRMREDSETESIAEGSRVGSVRENIHFEGRDEQPNSFAMHLEKDSVEDALRGKSIYLDSQNMLDDVGRAQAEEDSHMTEPKSAKRGKKEERARRLAAEQAVWVRGQFNLGEGEDLLASFSAALVKQILLQGKIHITSSSLCFYSRIFGRTTREIFLFTSIAKVKKRKGGFVANAIKIYFKDPTTTPVVIGSLNQRERAFNIIQKRWGELNPGAAHPREPDDGSAQGDSEDRSFEEEEDNNDRSISRNHSRDQVISVRNSALPANSPSGDPRNVNNKSAGSDTTSEPSSRKTSDARPATILEPLESSAPPPPSLVWRVEQDVYDSIAGNSYDKKTERARVVLDVPVLQAFNTLFVGDWLKHYHENTNNKDLTISDWYRASDGYMTRDLTFRRPLGYKIGPKETRVNEKQRYSFRKDGGVVVELTGQNVDAPYADYFVVETFFDLKPHADGNSTLLIASVAVHFFKSTILRGKIEAGAMSETKIAYQRLMNLASKRIDEHITSQAIQSHKHSRAEDPEPPDFTSPSSPTKKLRSSEGTAVVPGVSIVENLALPNSAQSECTTEKIQDDLEVQRKAAIVVTPVSGSIEVRDSSSTKWLRTLAVSALILACILLIAVLVLLHNMQNNVIALEKLVTENRLKAAAELCVKEGGSCGVDANTLGSA